MQSRLTQVLDEQSSTGKALLDIYSGLGIEVFDQEGQLRSFYDIMVDLSKVWGTLSTNEQEYIALTQAGSNQTQNFMALLSNFNTVLDATATAQNSVGSAAKENARFMESLAASTQSLKAEFQDLANNVIDNQLVKSLLNLAENALRVLNTEFGQTMIQIGLLTGLGWGATSLTNALHIFSSAAGQIMNLVGALKAGSAAAITFKSVAFPVIAIVSALAVGGYKLYEGWRKANPTLEEATEKLKSLEQIQKSNKDRLEEINNIPWYERTPEIEQEEQAIKNENDEIQKQIDKLNERKQLLYQEEANRGKTYFTNEYVAYGANNAIKIALEDANSVEEAWERLAKIQGTTIKELQESGWVINALPVEQYMTAEEYNEELISQARQYIQELKQTGKVEDSNFRSFLATIQQRSQGLIGLGRETEDLVVVTEELTTAYENAKVEAKETADGVRQQSAELDYLIGQYEQLNNEINKVHTASNSFNRADTLKGFVDSVNKATKEVKSFKGVSSETFGELLNILPSLTDAELTAQLGIQGLTGALFDSQGNLTATGNAALAAAGSFGQLANMAIKAQIAIAQSKMAMAQEESLGYIQGVTANDKYRINLARAHITAGTATAEDYQIVNQMMQNQSNVRKWQDVINNLNKLNQGISNAGGVNNIFGVGGGGGGTSAADNPADKALESFEALYEQIQHERAMDELSAEDYYAQLEQMVAEYTQVATEHMQEYGLTTDQINANMYKYEEEIYKGRKELAEDLAKEQERIRKEQERKYQEELREAERAYKESVRKQKEEWEKARREEQEALEKRKEAYEAAFNFIADKVQEEINALEDQKDDVAKYWDDKIDAINKNNEALNEQIKLEKLEGSLAKARQKQAYVFKDGRFQWVSDTEEVGKAQAELDKYKRDEALKKEVENLEKSKEEALKAIDEQIKGWEKYLENWSGVVDEYQKEQDKLLAEQILGTNLENKNWHDRLDNFQGYVDDYRKILDDLKKLQEEMANPPEPPPFVPPPKPDFDTGGSGSSSGGIVEDYPRPPKTLPVSDEDRAAIDRYKKQAMDAKARGDIAGINKAHDAAEAIRAEYGYSGGERGGMFNPIPKYRRYFLANGHEGTYANGTLSARGGMSLVGERGAELRVLNQGDGVIPAHITKNLWKWGVTSPANMMTQLSNIKNSTQSGDINIENLNLPEVKDAQGFVDFMKQNFYRRAVQFSGG